MLHQLSGLCITGRSVCAHHPRRTGAHHPRNHLCCRPVHKACVTLAVQACLRPVQQGLCTGCSPGAHQLSLALAVPCVRTTRGAPVRTTRGTTCAGPAHIPGIP